MKFDLKKFFSDKHHVFLVLILLLAFLIRLQFYDVNTGFWWDESEYLNMGKYFSKSLEMNLNAQRPLLFPLLIAGGYLLGLDVVGIRFLTVLIPSLLTVLFVYLLGKEMYDQKTGLIAASMMSLYWLLLFNTARVHSDPLGLMFNAGMLYFFWRGWVKERSTKYLVLAGIFGGAGFMTRIAALLVPIIILIYVLITERTKILKYKKQVLASVIVAFLVVIPYLLWVKKTFGSYFAFSSGYTNAGEGLPAAWNILSFIGPQYMGMVFFWFMILGLAVTLFYFIIGFDIFWKGRDDKLKSDFMIILFVLMQVGYFIFIQRAAEDRWLMPAMIGLFILSARGVMTIYNPIQKWNKAMGVLFIILILALGGYWHYKQADTIIDARKDSEANVQLAGQWMAERTNPGDVIMSSNVHMELLHASERKIQSFGSDENETISLIKETRPKYLMMSLYYRSEDWHYQFPEKHADKLKLAKMYEENGQPTLWIFEVDADAF